MRGRKASRMITNETNGANGFWEIKKTGGAGLLGGKVGSGGLERVRQFGVQRSAQGPVLFFGIEAQRQRQV